MKYLFSFLLLCSIASAGESKYINVEANDLVVQVQGNGSEDGLRILVPMVYKYVVMPNVIIDPEKNAAGCTLRSIELTQSQNLPYGIYQLYSVIVDTEVEGDSGGCEVAFENSWNQKTFSVVEYVYVTDY